MSSIWTVKFRSKRHEPRPPPASSKLHRGIARISQPSRCYPWTRSRLENCTPQLAHTKKGCRCLDLRSSGEPANSEAPKPKPDVQCLAQAPIACHPACKEADAARPALLRTSSAETPSHRNLSPHQVENRFAKQQPPRLSHNTSPTLPQEIHNRGWETEVGSCSSVPDHVLLAEDPSPMRSG